MATKLHDGDAFLKAMRLSDIRWGMSGIVTVWD